MRNHFRRSPIARLLLCVISLFCVSRSRAATDQPDQSGNPLKQLSLEELGSIQVTTASKEPEEVWNTPAAIYVITHDDIERSGATSIPEALRLAPGVEVARIDSNMWAIGIRGFGSRLSRSVLVLIDGRTVYTTLIAGTYWEVQDYVLEDVDRIEVIRGPGGTIWGPNAVNGVINIITKSSKDTHGAYVNVGGGNEEEGFFNSRYGGGDGKTFDYRMYAKGFNRGPEYHPDNMNYDRWRAAQVGFRMDWSRNERDTFDLHGDIYDEGQGESVGVITYAPPYARLVNSTAPLSGWNLTGHWKRVFSEGNDVQVEAYIDRTNRQEANFSDIRNTFDIDFMDRFRLPGRQQISLGLGARASKGDDKVVVSGLAFSPNNRTDELYTGFVLDEIDLVENRLTLAVGTKLLKTNYTGFELEPSARLLWKPTAKQSVWAAFTHALRTPSDGERDFFLTGYIGTAAGLPSFARFNANPNFRSEELNGYELGYRRLLTKRVYVDLAAFYNHHGNLFSEDLTGPAYIESNPAPVHVLLPAEFGNGLVGTTSGGEFAPEWKVTDRWRLRASYSFLQMDLHKGTGSQDVGTAPSIVGSSPKHQVMIQSAFDLSKVFNLDLAYRYISALPGQAVPSYSTGDARFAWQARNHLQFSVVGRNLFQPHHTEFGGDVGIKRSVYGQIAVQR